MPHVTSVLFAVAYMAIASTGNWIFDIIFNGTAFIFIVGVTYKASSRLKGIEDKLVEHDAKFKERQLDTDDLRGEIKHLLLESPLNQVRHRILLIEDYDQDELLFRKILARSFEVSSAKTLSEAHVKLESEVFDCILLDMSLPDVKREEVVSIFLSKHPDALCLAMSGYDGVESIALKQGAHSFLRKTDMNRAYVEKMIKHAIIRHKNSQAAAL